ncbi:MAG TPA: sigma-54 dependent transcriptional regulator [Longimicrobiales bacterium]
MDALDRILGRSAAAAALREFGRRAAAVDASVLLTGETGTGKGLLARAIHECSRRARAPFIAINCAGVPETLFESEFFGHTRGAFTGAQQSHRGLFEQATAGTLFLDEVGELPLPLQAKLLTALEDGEIRRLGGERTLRVDVRIIAAAGVDLERAVAERRFRRDLYHRLLVLSYRLPPLRERDGDLEFLARHFLDHFATRYQRPARSFSPAALARMQAYSWPGNIRELAHAVEAAVLACDAASIGVAHLPTTLTSPPPPLDHASAIHEHLAPYPALPPGAAGTGAPALDGVRAHRILPRVRYSFYGSADEERRRIEEALRLCRGNKTRAAAALGMARNTLRLKLRHLGLDAHKRPEPAGR